MSSVDSIPTGRPPPFVVSACDPEDVPGRHDAPAVALERDDDRVYVTDRGMLEAWVCVTVWGPGAAAIRALR
jgi:hypothetical protein